MKRFVKEHLVGIVVGILLYQWYYNNQGGGELP